MNYSQRFGGYNNPNNVHNPLAIELPTIVRNQNNEPMYQAIVIGEERRSQVQSEDSNRRSSVVRENVRNELKSAIKESLSINFLCFLVSMTKVFLTVIVFFHDEVCDGPLKLWLILMMMHDIFYAFSLVMLIKTIISNDPNTFSRQNNPRNRDSVSDLDIDLSSVLRRNSLNNEEINAFNVNYGAERKNQIAKISLEISKLYYIVIFIYGNVVFFSERICTKENTPLYWALALTYLLMGYVYLSIPIFIVISVCVCLPIVIVIYFFVARQGRVHPARTAIINKLERNKYKLDSINKECCICMVEYQPNDELIALPCNQMHEFHSACIISWLKINGVCPICRKGLEENQTQPQNNNINNNNNINEFSNEHFHI